MPLKTFRPLAIGAAILTLGAGGVALAQQPPGPPDGRPGMMMRGERPDPAAMAARHAQRLRDSLQLRPDQEPALRALMDAMTPPPGAMERMREARAERQALTTPQRLDRMAARMADHQAMFDRRATAIKRFYAQLSPSQQRAFDALPPMGMHGRKGMMMRGMGGHGGHGGHGDGHHDEAPMD